MKQKDLEVDSQVVDPDKAVATIKEALELWLANVASRKTHDMLRDEKENAMQWVQMNSPPAGQPSPEIQEIRKMQTGLARRKRPGDK